MNKKLICEKQDAEGFICGLDSGHSGNHIAFGPDGKQIITTWSDSDASESLNFVRVTPAMAKRMLSWLQETGIVELSDATTIDDLMLAEKAISSH